MANNGDIVVMNDRLRMAVGIALSASPKDIQEATRRRRNSLGEMVQAASPKVVAYSGYFAVTEYSSTQSAIASGVVVINGTRYLVTGLTMTISATVTICLDVMAVAQSGASASGRFVAVSGTVTNAYYIPIAVVNFSSGAITSISQIYTGERLSEAAYWSES